MDALGVVGCLCSLSFIILGCASRRKRLGATGNVSLRSRLHDPSDEMDLESGFPAKDQLSKDAVLMSRRVKASDLNIIRQIANGAEGVVYLGELRNQKVAVKRCHAHKSSEDQVVEFANEAKFLGKFKHPKVVQFIGVAWTSYTDFSIITEFMNCGDLRGLLASDKIVLTWIDHKYDIAINVAESLVFLHEQNPPVIHRDLKSKNILIDSKSGAKLSDFGLSRNYTTTETLTQGVGTVRWTAPEIVLGMTYDTKVDVYSFGIVLSELATHKLPFHDARTVSGDKPLIDLAVLHEVAHHDLRPSFGHECPSGIRELAEACLQRDPKDRPSATEMLSTLVRVIRGRRGRKR